jgi:tetratricopeptide (TPR) repeat protein
MRGDRRRWLALACILPLAGCGTLGHRDRHAKKDPEPAPGVAGALGMKPDKVVDKARFEARATREQEVGVHIDLARLLETEGNFDSAVAEYQKAIDAADAPGRHHDGPRATAEQKALAHRRMAGALDRLGRFAQAETHYRQALKLDPDNPKVWNDAGYSYYLQHRWPDAIRSLKTAAKLAPNDGRIQTNLGLALAGSGKDDEALAALTRVGGAAVAHANLGYILASTGKMNEAREHYQMALQIQPQFEPARVALARLDADPAGHAPPATMASVPFGPTTDGGLSRASADDIPPPVRR